MQPNRFYPYNIPVSFHFQVIFHGRGAKDDSRFQEVGGLTAEMGVEELAVGGENKFTYRLPTRAKYANLVLKRGMIRNSELIGWFRSGIQDFIFEPLDLNVNLLNEEHQVISSWKIIQAYPVKWAVSDLNANGNTLVIETIEFAYQYFERMPEKN
jgi:phage tail-like protein